MGQLEQMGHLEHLSEEELVGQAYGEGTVDARQHLESCGECARAFGGLRRDLADVEIVEPPLRDPLYGEEVWAKLSGSLPLYGSRRQSGWGFGLWKGLSYAAVCVLLVAGAFYAGRVVERVKKPPVAANNSGKSAPQPKQPIVVVVLSDHLDQSERLLVELKHADPGSAEMVSPLRDEARKLLAANRVCRKDAAQVDDPALNTALDRLDHVLNELANQPGGLDTASITRLQDEMNTDGLLFEVRVLRSRIPDRQAAGIKHGDGGKI